MKRETRERMEIEYISENLTKGHTGKWNGKRVHSWCIHQCRLRRAYFSSLFRSEGNITAEKTRARKSKKRALKELK